MKKLFALLPLLVVVLFPHASARAEGAPPAIQKDAKRDLAKLFDGKLVDGEGKPVKTDDIKKAKYTLVYFSAHWCPPCRAFTPELVKFVNENRKDGNFAVAFVSSDESKEKMLGYIKEAKMPWGGTMDKGSLGDIGLGVNSIPRVRVFDAEGKLVLESKELGRPETMKRFKALLGS